MPRPRRCRRLGFHPKIHGLRPHGGPTHHRLPHHHFVEITAEEVEALRLKNLKELDQNECAKMMNTSQSTFQRILASAYKKISEAIVEGKAIRITK